MCAIGASTIKALSCVEASLFHPGPWSAKAAGVIEFNLNFNISQKSLSHPNKYIKPSYHFTKIQMQHISMDLRVGIEIMASPKCLEYTSRS